MLKLVGRCRHVGRLINKAVDARSGEQRERFVRGPSSRYGVASLFLLVLLVGQSLPTGVWLVLVKGC